MAGTLSGYNLTEFGGNTPTVTLLAAAAIGDRVIALIWSDAAATHATATLTGALATGGFVEKKFAASATSACTLLVADVTTAGTPTINGAVVSTQSFVAGWILSASTGSSTPIAWSDSNHAPLAGAINPARAGVYIEGYFNGSADNFSAWNDGATQDSGDAGFVYRTAHKTGIAAGSYSPGCTLLGAASAADLLIGGYFDDVAAGPSITAQPGDQSILLGQTAVFSVAATSSGSITYQWQVSTDRGATFNNVTHGSGGTTSSYTTATTNDSEAANIYQYRCNVTDSNGTTTSGVATLYVNGAASIPWTAA